MKCQELLLQRGILLADGEGLWHLVLHVMDLGGITQSCCVWVVFSLCICCTAWLERIPFLLLLSSFAG